MKINLGCANDIKDGYVNIDINSDNPNVKKADVRCLDFIDSESVDEVYAKDIIEHLSLEDGKKAIKEWSRVLCHGGIIHLQTVNFDKQIEAYRRGVWSIEDLIYMVFAGVNWINGITRTEDYHKCAYTFDLLEKILGTVNIKVKSVHYDEIGDALIKNPRSHNLNITIIGVKE